MSQFKYRVTRDLVAFQDYCKTFDFDLFCEHYVGNSSISALNDKTKVKQALITHFEPLKEDLLTYKNDFHKFKSVEDIANKIGITPDRVKAYIERNKLNFSKDQINGLSGYGDVTLKTQVKEISSYKILKDLQLIERNILLSKTTAQSLMVK
ncbi:hypothetical protein [Gelidibacter algens]|nr:hypothetical protein [Gelidibacter algens]